MPSLPIYFKTADAAARPTDPIFYWVTRCGVFLCRNSTMFASDVKVDYFPRTLALHCDQCQIDLPRLPTSALEYIVGFFSRVFDLYQSESIVLLFWEPKTKRYKLVVPDQTATVWQSSQGLRTPLDVKYEVPVNLLGRYMLLGDIHCHGDMSSYASHTDQFDELHRDGIHAVVGHIDREVPTFHVEMSIDRARFSLHFDDIFAGYRGRRRIVPNKWLEKVKVTTNRPQPLFYENGQSYR